MNRNMYIVVDQVSNLFVGGIQLHVHDAPAIRMFGDLLSDPQGLGRHPADFDLVCCGVINSGGNVTEISDRVVLKGSAWLASQSSEV